MEPLDPGTNGVALPQSTKLLAMFPWRIVGAVALSSAFGLIGWEIKRRIDDQSWSDPIMWASILCTVLAAVCVLCWTWCSVANARRLVEPASTIQLPDPKRAVAMWVIPFAFVALAIIVVAYLGVQVNTTADGTVSSVPLAVAVVALLLAIPLTYRPMHYLAGIVRQVGGHSSNLSQWMWVPVVLGFIGVGSIVALRMGGATSDSSGSVHDASQWAPLWVVAVVAIAPCVIVVLLAWRAAASVEEAIVLAAHRRARSPLGWSLKGRSMSTHRASVGRLDASTFANRKRVRLIPGVDLLRLCIVTLLAGLAMLTAVGAAVMFMFWLESNDGVLLASQRDRAWDAFDVLYSGARFVGFGLIVLVSVWTFVAVSNVRMASARRRNPFIAAVAWPAAAIGFWRVADRLVVDQTAGVIIVGLAVQAAMLYVPFFVLERSAEAVGARRTPLRITYMAGVVLLVYVQVLGGLSTIEESADSDFGRIAAFLAVGALLQLLSTLAVTEACRAIEDATARVAESHNLLVEQRDAATHRQARAQSAVPHFESTAALSVDLPAQVPAQ